MKKIPAIRFPQFKEPWDHRQLNELLSESKQKNADLRYEKDEVLSVSGELGIVNQIEHLGRSYAGESVHNYGVVEVGDIVYTKSPLKANPFGIIKINRGNPGIVSTLYAIYKVKKENADGEFLDYYFSLDANTNRYLRPLVKKGAKNDMKINNAYVLHDRIFAPSIPEQKRIVSFLKIVDEKLNELRERQSLLVDYKKGMMQKIFSQELRFKDDNGEEFSEWKKKKLGDVVKVTSGGTPSRSQSKYWKGNIPWISTSLIDFKMIASSEEYITTEGLNNSSAKLFPKGTILMAMYGQGKTRGKVAILGIEATTNQACAALIINQNINGQFLFQNLSSRYDEIRDLSNDGGQQNLSGGLIKGIEINLPGIQEQNKIADFVIKIDSKIESVSEQLEETKAYKKAMLQNLFFVQL